MNTVNISKEVITKYTNFDGTVIDTNEFSYHEKVDNSDLAVEVRGSELVVTISQEFSGTSSAISFLDNGFDADKIFSEFQDDFGDTEFTMEMLDKVKYYIGRALEFIFETGIEHEYVESLKEGNTPITWIGLSLNTEADEYSYTTKVFADFAKKESTNPSSPETETTTE